MSIPAPRTHLSKEAGKRRREHLRNIHRLTHEQQIALIEEARVARSREQDQGQ
jgi:hypothetical protein